MAGGMQILAVFDWDTIRTHTPGVLTTGKHLLFASDCIRQCTTQTPSERAPAPSSSQCPVTRRRYSTAWWSATAWEDQGDLFSGSAAAFRIFRVLYAGGVKHFALLGCALVISGSAQKLRASSPRFEDYPALDTFRATPARPVLRTPDERKFRVVITQGVSKGRGVFDGITGKEQPKPGPNFAGHYILILGSGSPDFPCLMAAIVDASTGRVYAPPRSPAVPYFCVFSDTPGSKSSFEYRLNSRLLIAHVCEFVAPAEGPFKVQVGPGNWVPSANIQILKPRGCGPHYYVMEQDGLSLIDQSVDDDAQSRPAHGSR